MARKALSTKELLVKTKTPKKAKATVAEKIQLVINNIKEAFVGEFGEYYFTTSELVLSSYIDKALSNGYVALDTETTGLDPMNDKVVGFSLFTEGERGIYIPIRHDNCINMAVHSVQRQLRRLQTCKIIMANADFDLRMLQNSLDIKLNCWWDCILAQRLLNENEPSNGLKPLHDKYCGTDSHKKSKTFKQLFKELTFNMVPYDVSYVYAAKDTRLTYELFKFQEPYLTKGTPQNKAQGLEKTADLFHEIEMPLVEVIISMENTGIAIHRPTLDSLKNKYKELAENEFVDCSEILERYADDINAYKIANPDHKLSDPINVNSHTQLAVLLYDIFKLPIVNPEKPRTTDKAALDLMDHEFVISLLEYRKQAKMLSTYINKMYPIIKDGRIHCSYNQIGADTGRLSSSSPNLQNIPKKGGIRAMFKATDGYILLGADLSSQEPRLTAHICNDEKMIQAFLDQKDIYSEVASLAFGLPYEECVEKRPDGTTSKDGKERRSKAKAIVLGRRYAPLYSNI